MGNETDLSPELMDELVHLVKYSTECHNQIVQKIYRRHPKIRKIWDEKDKKLKAQVIANIRAVVERVQYFLKPFPKNRCPDCGKLVVTRRCLVCDLEKKIVKETI